MIIRPEPNKPLTVNLLYASAKETKGKYGIDFQYTLKGGNALFVPPIAHEEIQKLHAGPGEPFTLTKTIGPGNAAVWKVERIVEPSAPEQAAKPERPAPSQIGVAKIVPQNGKAPVSVMPGPEQLQTRQSKAMAKQLIAAIDAGIAATAYAKSQNFPLELTSRDICAIAISGSIQQFREGVY